MSSFLRDESGLTLTELLVVSVLMLVVLSAAFMAFTTVDANVNALTAQTELSDRTDGITEVVTRELRQAEEIQVGGGVFVAASGDDVTFYSHVNAGEAPQRVRYYRLGNSLYKTVDEPSTQVYPYDYLTGQTRLVTGSLASTGTPIFRYFKNDVPPTEVLAPTGADLNQLSLVGVSVTSEKTVAGSRKATHTSNSKVKIRCMFDSLN